MTGTYPDYAGTISDTDITLSFDGADQFEVTGAMGSETSDNTFSSGLSDTMVFTGSSSPFGMTWEPAYTNCEAECDNNTRVILTCDVLGTLAPTLSRDGETTRLIEDNILIVGTGDVEKLSYEKCD